MQLKTNVLSQPSKCKVSKINKSNLAEVEKAALESNYPSEEQPSKSEQSYISLPTRKVKAHTIQVDPSETRLWKGNPRNFAINVDVSDLLPLIKKGKGNAQPVLARKLTVPDNQGVQFEIIAGCRRRLCCIEASLKLTINLVDVNDDEAKFLAEAENDGRKDTDFFTDCRYLKFNYDNLKSSDSNLDIETFAAAQAKPISRQTMNEKLKLAEISDWILVLVNDPYTWGLRKGIRLKSLLNRAELDKEALEKSCRKKSFASADKLLQYIENFIGSKVDIEPRDFIFGKSKITVSENAKGHTSISIPKGISKEVKNKIESVIKELAHK